MLLVTMDQISDATYQIKHFVKTVLPSVLLPPWVWETFNMNFPTDDSLGFLDPSHLESVFFSVELGLPDLSYLLQEFPQDLGT